VSGFSKREMAGLLAMAYMYRRVRAMRKDNRNMGISAVDNRAREEAKANPLVRKRYNEMILDRLREIVKSNPSKRFSQLMAEYGLVRHERPVSQKTADKNNMNWRDEYHLESEALLERVERRVKGRSED
jgi:uncharacterized protein (UPF0371 family)